LIKDSKNSDSSLVSNENLSKVLLSSGWALGQVTWAKMAKNLPHLLCHSEKIRNLNQNFFYIADSKACRVFSGIEQLSNAISWGAMQLVSLPKYPCFFLTSKYDIFIDWQRMC